MTFKSIQALRAVAALLVVLFHSFQMWGQRVDAYAPGVTWGNGAAGVDIFFVVSGFVMAVSSRRLADQPFGWLTFLKNRFTRIVPLYWLMTTLKLLTVAFAGSLALRSDLSFNFVASSYALLPVTDQAGHFRPLLPVGWTLTFEGLFYIVFAVALALRADIRRVLLSILGFMAVLALFRTADWPVWTLMFDTIVLEFAFGVILGQATLRGWRMPSSAAPWVLAAGFAFILIFGMADTQWRVLIWGVPSLAIVAAAVSLEEKFRHEKLACLMTLGDASYSLYLSHGFVLPMLGVAIGFLGYSGLLIQSVTIAASLIVCSLVGLAVYRWVEVPLLNAMGRGPSRGRPREAALTAA